MIIPLDPVTPLDPTTGALHTTLATTDALPNPLTRIPNRLAPTSPLLILPFVALSTPSLVASLVEDPLLLPERNTSAIFNASTILPTPITNAACHQQDDPMVITVEIKNYAIKKVLVDQGNSIDILYWATYQKLQLPDTATVPYDESIYGFSGEQVSTRGYIDLHTVFRDGTQTKTIPIRFLIVDAPTSYNVLLGRPSLNTLGAVVSTPHLAMKFLSPSGDILTVHCDQRLARECYMASLRPQLPLQQTNHIE